MTGSEFIISMFCDDWTFNDPHPITEEEAAYNIKCYKEEGLPVPVSVTPVLFARVWNLQYQKVTKGGTK